MVSFLLMVIIITQKKTRLGGDHFTNPSILKKLPGNFAIGHNRYSYNWRNFKKYSTFFADLHMGGLSIAHNGKLTNARF